MHLTKIYQVFLKHKLLYKLSYLLLSPCKHFIALCDVYSYPFSFTSIKAISCSCSSWNRFTKANIKTMIFVDGINIWFNFASCTEKEKQLKKEKKNSNHIYRILTLFYFILQFVHFWLFFIVLKASINLSLDSTMKTKKQTKSN